jgi:hypothetical protein
MGNTEARCLQAFHRFIEFDQPGLIGLVEN